MGSRCSCDADESTFNAGFFSCSFKHFDCFAKKTEMSEERQEKFMNEIAARVEERLQAAHEHVEEKVESGKKTEEVKIED